MLTPLQTKAPVLVPETSSHQPHPCKPVNRKVPRNTCITHFYNLKDRECHLLELPGQLFPAPDDIIAIIIKISIQNKDHKDASVSQDSVTTQVTHMTVCYVEFLTKENKF